MRHRAKIYGATMGAVFLLWQLTAVVHLVFVMHSFCPIHGDIEHVDARTGHLEHHHDHGSSTPAGDTGGGDRGCFVLNLMTWGSGVAQQQVLANHLVPEPIGFLSPVPLTATAVLHSERYRFRMAPSLSPPAEA